MLAGPAWAEPLRIATFDAGLSRDGPGLLLRDIQREEAQVMAAADVITAAQPDILLLTGFDWDYQGQALAGFAALLEGQGVSYPYRFAARPNSGVPTGFDLDGNGRTTDPPDAQGYGRFTGDSGLAILSRYPIAAQGVRDFSSLLWRDLPDTLIAGADLTPEAQAVQRLSSTGHWDVPITLPEGELHLWGFAATAPVFDGPEDRNGRRNHDEAALWLRYLDGDLTEAPADAPFVLLGKANLDPAKGEGRREALLALLTDPRLQDPLPSADTADFGGDLGAMRVDYVLPDARLKVLDAGVYGQTTASRHGLVWIEVDWPTGGKSGLR